jgi:hypothetical protein
VAIPRINVQAQSMADLLELLFGVICELLAGLLELMCEISWGAFRAWRSGESLYRMLVAVATVLTVLALGAFVWLLFKA